MQLHDGAMQDEVAVNLFLVVDFLWMLLLNSFWMSLHGGGTQDEVTLNFCLAVDSFRTSLGDYGMPDEAEGTVDEEDGVEGASTV